MPTPDPFPLNIAEKEDSALRLLLLASIPDEYKYTAGEFNKVLEALKFLRENLGSGPGGSSLWGTITGNIENQTDLIELLDIGNKPVENRYVTAPNNVLATMYADQANQTDGFIQLVGDASDDPAVTSGKAYYEYKGTTNGNLTDYEKLSNEQAQLLEGSLAFLQKTVRLKQENYNDYSNMANGFIFAQEANAQISALIFDMEYSKCLGKFKELFEAGKSIALRFVNVTQNTTFYAEVSNIELVGLEDYVKLSFSNDIPTAEIAINDVFQCFLPYTSSGGGGTSNQSKVKIGRLWFDTVGNTDTQAIEVGNTFEGYPTTSRYVVGRVIALPFDVDDNTKVKLIMDTIE